MVPAGELEPVRAPLDVGAQGDDLAIVFAEPTAAGVPGEQQGMRFHQAIDAFGVDRRAIGASPLTLCERGYTPGAVG